MILAGVNRTTRTRTLSATNLKLSGPASNQVLQGERTANNRLRHGTSKRNMKISKIIYKNYEYEERKTNKMQQLDDYY